MPWPTPEPMAARPMAKPAPTAESAGIQTLPSAACAAVGATRTAVLSAATGADVAWEGGERCTAGTKALLTDARSALPANNTAAVAMRERGAAIFQSSCEGRGTVARLEL